MGWIELAIAIITLINKAWNTIKEYNDELKKKKTEILQSGLRGVIDRDKTRITQSFDDFNNL